MDLGRMELDTECRAGTDYSRMPQPGASQGQNGWKDPTGSERPYMAV